MRKYLLFILVFITIGLPALAAASETATSRYYTSIQKNPQKIKKFMFDMPKGGDLHNHASGSTFAENLLKYAENDNLCVQRTTFVVYMNTECKPGDILNLAIQDVSFKDALIDAWSMQHFQGGQESGHDHFFNTFRKFNAITHHHTGEILAEIVDRAAKQNELYVETMLTPDGNASGKLGKKLGWDRDFPSMRAKLLANNFSEIVAGMTTYLNDAEAKMRSELQCGTANAKPGCRIALRYQYQVAREQPPEMVFAQLLAGFEGASKDKRIIGINMVQPEDGRISMGNYRLHMQMVRYLHNVYPKVHISLHAGELSQELVPAEGLKFHINDAVTIAGAERIGHGVDIMFEDNYPQLLKYMADNHVMVEINLSSNAGILKVEGKNHPLPLYMQYGVPVALSTDDEGISRDIMTTEYVKAVSTYQIDYLTLKNMVRNSISYAFIPGDNLWHGHDYKKVDSSCRGDLGMRQPSKKCKKFLASSEKAALQWELEKRFMEFENRFSN